MSVDKSDVEWWIHGFNIGQATVSMNSTQMLIYHIFQEISGLDHAIAAAIFFSLKADSAQRDVAKAVAEAAFSSEVELKNRVIALIDRAGKLSGDRNAAVHSFWAKSKDGVTIVPYLPSHRRLDKTDPAKTIAELLPKLDSLCSDLNRLLVDLHLRRSSLGKALQQSDPQASSKDSDPPPSTKNTEPPPEPSEA